MVTYAPRKRILIRKDNCFRKSKGKDEKNRSTYFPYNNARDESTMKPGIILKS